MAKNQSQIVTEVMEKLGGLATLGLIIQETLEHPEFKFSGKTPQANIRRIVQQSKDLYKIKPGLYGLKSMEEENEKKGAVVETLSNINSKVVEEFTHGYYQGLLLEIGKMKKLETFSPNQDNRRKYLNKELVEIRTLSEIPNFSFDIFVKRVRTIDAIWFHSTKDELMPQCFFEVEHSTDIQNSLLKYADLRDFSAKKYIVADEKRKAEFDDKLKYTSFDDIRNQVEFLSYKELVKQYEHYFEKSTLKTLI